MENIASTKFSLRDRSGIQAATAAKTILATEKDRRGWNWMGLEVSFYDKAGVETLVTTFEPITIPLNEVLLWLKMQPEYPNLETFAFTGIFDQEKGYDR